MKTDDYKEYISAETMMGPNSVRILEELFHKYPLRLHPDDVVLDLGCGTGLTSLIIAKETGVVLIGIPGLKDEYTGRAEELLVNWLGDESYMFKSPKQWKELIGRSDRIESVKTWEMDCFRQAWDDWLAADNKFALGDRQHFETIIKPYTCFVGIYIGLKKAKRACCYWRGEKQCAISGCSEA